MSRFNKTTKMKNTTTNHEGAKAYKLTPEMKLYTLCCTFSLSNKFYEDSTNQMDRLRTLIKQVSPKFVAKLAIYTREQMYLRTVPLVLTVELAKIHRGDNLISKLVQRVVQRADEINELLAYYQKANDRTGTKKLNKLSNQIKKGIKNIFESGKFREYHFSKYNRKTDVRFRDALFLTHPKPADAAMKSLFDKITSDTLDTVVTWETQMSEAGKSDSPTTSKKTVWEELIINNKMGYMALLRNLRNFLQEGVSGECIDIVCTKLTDPGAVANSKQLPFRFYSAYRMLERVDSVYKNTVLKSLETAIKLSVSNIPGFDNEKVLIATDTSASMMQPVSQNSIIQLYDIGAILAMSLQSKCKKFISGMFGSHWKTFNYTNDNIIANTMDIRNREGEVGYSTNGYKVLEWALDNNHNFDKIMIFCDTQLYGSYHDEGIIDYWNRYSEKHPHCKLYMFDLAGYGDTPLEIKGNVHLISGWSEKIFSVMDAIENGGDTLDAITEITL